MTYNLTKLSDHELKTKIRRAYAWLITHESPMNKEGLGFKLAMEGNSWKHNPQEYNINLKFYESAVDEARSRAINEKDCWTYQDETMTIDNMTLEEIVLTMVK